MIGMPAADSQGERGFMERAVALARQSVSEEGKVSPKVGAVVTRDGVLVGGGVSR
jgi:pyrimidine deaminase RibD-like protein